ncbi:hypothetical protein D3C86_1653700 [compost metagenome]
MVLQIIRHLAITILICAITLAMAVIKEISLDLPMVAMVTKMNGGTVQTVLVLIVQIERTDTQQTDILPIEPTDRIALIDLKETDQIVI